MSLRSFNLTQSPIVALLHPRERTGMLLWASALGLVAWGIAVWRVGLPTWGAVTIFLGIVLVPGVLKWHDDIRRYGVATAVLSILLAMQGFHTIEHGVQMVQYHVLNWPPFRSSGLLSAANTEWVHFIWNWSVVAVVIFVMWKGRMRNPWAWMLITWAVLHSLEHSYMMYRYLMVKQELIALGIPKEVVSAQGLPGILGRDGWLANSSICGRIPGLTTLSRIDIHFWWNAGEILLLLAAAHTYLRKIVVNNNE